MDGWVSFWGWLFVGTLVVFAVLAVAVTIGGFFDVRAMFRSVNAQHADGRDPNDRIGETPKP